MEAILRDLPHVSIYLDDILVMGDSEVTHLQNLSAVLEKLKAAGVRLKGEKYLFMMLEVEYLGHRISARGLQPLPSKVQAIQEAPTPKDVSQLRSFLGLLSYYGHFLPDLATLLSLLYELLQSSRRWSWEQPQEKALREAKNLLTKSNVLIHYDLKSHYICRVMPLLTVLVPCYPTKWKMAQRSRLYWLCGLFLRQNTSMHDWTRKPSFLVLSDSTSTSMGGTLRSSLITSHCSIFWGRLMAFLPWRRHISNVGH